jgi:predicted TPR repeat methyltransferase
MTKLDQELQALQALCQQGDLESAKNGYLSYLRHSPDSAPALDALGLLAAQERDYPAAIRYLADAIRYAPTQPSYLLHLANIYKIQKNYEPAIKLLQQVVTLQPNYAPAWNNLGTIYFAQQDFTAAITCYQTAITHGPSFVDAYYNLGLAFTRTNQLVSAYKVYEKLLALDADLFAARFHLACLLLREEKWSQALPHFITIAQSQPFHFETQVNLANCYMKLGLLTEAKRHYQSAIEITPNDYQVLFNLGVVNMQLGQLDAAIQSYQKALHITPDFFDGHNNLGVAFLAKQYYQFALEQFQAALKLQPHNTALQYIVQMLAQQNPQSAAPTYYIASLFDAYADHYETHLLTALDYQLPALMMKALASLKKNKYGEKNIGKDILDLGCGTGLCGAAIKTQARSLVGVDLSANMLAMAAAKNIYDNLIHSAIEPYLQTQQAQFDLILAGDVFVYIGDLDPVIKFAAQALRRNGLIIFNTEIGENTYYQLTQSGRFIHQKSYIELLAESYELSVKFYQKVLTRQQNNAPVYGHLFILQKNT